MFYSQGSSKENVRDLGVDHISRSASRHMIQVIHAIFVHQVEEKL